MDAEKKYVTHIMDIGLIRKKILGYLLNFKDIICIASTCWHLDQIINNEKIITYIFYEKWKINIEFRCICNNLRNLDVHEESKFEDYTFVKSVFLTNCEENKYEKSNRDIPICNNTVEISFIFQLLALRIEFLIRSLFNKFENFFCNKNAVDEIMRQLSNKNNATIHFKYFDVLDISLVTGRFLVIFTFAMKYGVKVTLCEETLLKLRYRYIYDALRIRNCSIEQCVRYCLGNLIFYIFVHMIV
uniref:F-box domain-containing protein n=1 Tax=Strongyloides papillosus TaxID=174720 RepID=A0A0N5BVB0_STREA